MTHFCQSLSPYCIVPRMIFDTFNPELPRRTVPCVSVRHIPSDVARELLTVSHFFGSRGAHFVWLRVGCEGCEVSKKDTRGVLSITMRGTFILDQPVKNSHSSRKQATADNKIYAGSVGIHGQQLASLWMPSHCSRVRVRRVKRVLRRLDRKRYNRSHPPWRDLIIDVWGPLRQVRLIPADLAGEMQGVKTYTVCGQKSRHTGNC